MKVPGVKASKAFLEKCEARTKEKIDVSRTLMSQDEHIVRHLRCAAS